MYIQNGSSKFPSWALHFFLNQSKIFNDSFRIFVYFSINLYMCSGLFKQLSKVFLMEFRF